MTIKRSYDFGLYTNAALLSAFLLSLIFIAFRPLSAEEPILLATRPTIPPYVYGRAETGIEIDLLNAIFNEMGQKIKYVQLPRVRMVQSFNRGEMQGVLTQNISVSNAGCAADWYLKAKNVGFSLNENNTKLNITNE